MNQRHPLSARLPPGSPVLVRRGHGRKEPGTLTGWDGSVMGGQEKQTVEERAWVTFADGPARVRASKIVRVVVAKKKETTRT